VGRRWEEGKGSTIEEGVLGRVGEGELMGEGGCIVGGRDEG